MAFDSEGYRLNPDGTRVTAGQLTVAQANAPRVNSFVGSKFGDVPPGTPGYAGGATNAFTGAKSSVAGAPVTPNTVQATADPNAVVNQSKAYSTRALENVKRFAGQSTGQLETGLDALEKRSTVLTQRAAPRLLNAATGLEPVNQRGGNSVADQIIRGRVPASMPVSGRDLTSNILKTVKPTKEDALNPFSYRQFLASVNY